MVLKPELDAAVTEAVRTLAVAVARELAPGIVVTCPECGVNTEMWFRMLSADRPYSPAMACCGAILEIKPVCVSAGTEFPQTNKFGDPCWCQNRTADGLHEPRCRTRRNKIPPRA